MWKIIFFFWVKNKLFLGFFLPRSLRESKSMYAKARELAVEYAKFKGKGTQVTNNDK